VRHDLASSRLLDFLVNAVVACLQPCTTTMVQPSTLHGLRGAEHVLCKLIEARYSRASMTWPGTWTSYNEQGSDHSGGRDIRVFVDNRTTQQDTMAPDVQKQESSIFSVNQIGVGGVSGSISMLRVRCGRKDQNDRPSTEPARPNGRQFVNRTE
jgi:hypothetical protein